jgi:AcrR family transcriptional regulator
MWRVTARQSAIDANEERLRTTVDDTLDTRDRIKKTARSLFAERGVEAVTVREIVAASGAKNGGSLNYYFGSKEGLITELLADVLGAASEGWLEHLSMLEKSGGAKSVRDVIHAIVYGGLSHHATDAAPTAARFLASVLFTRRRMVRDLMDRLHFTVFTRLLRYIQELRPDIPLPIMRQRLLFLAWYLISVESAWEASLAERKRSPIWSDADPLMNIVETAAALVEAPLPASAAEAKARLKSSPRKTTRDATAPRKPRVTARGAKAGVPP